MKNRKLKTGIIAMGIMFATSMAVAQQPIGPIGGPGPVISAPGSSSELGQQPVPNIPPGPGAQQTPPPPAGVPLEVTPPTPNWENSGMATVVACGYDAQGVWQTIPLRIQYNWNGAQYNVTVVNAWNPWTQCWDYDVDVPAFSTSYFINDTTFNWYTNLSTGTFYFNL